MWGVFLYMYHPATQDLTDYWCCLHQEVPSISDKCNKWKLLSSVLLFATPRNSLGQSTRVGSLSLLQGIFPTQGLNLGLPHCRWILYQLSHKRSPRILEWVAYPFSRSSSRLRNWTGVSCIAGGFLTNWAIREACVCSVTYIMYVTEFSLNFLSVLLEYFTSAIGEIWELPKTITWRFWVAIRLLL